MSSYRVWLAAHHLNKKEVKEVREVQDVKERNRRPETGLRRYLRRVRIFQESLAFDQPGDSEGEQRSRLEKEHGADRSEQVGLFDPELEDGDERQRNEDLCRFFGVMSFGSFAELCLKRNRQKTANVRKSSKAEV